MISGDVGFAMKADVCFAMKGNEMRIRSLTMVIVLATGLLAAGGSAVAAADTSSSGTGVIQGCVDNNVTMGGVQRLAVLATGKTSCPDQTTPLDWNQQGPQGPAGPQGATGAQGPAGPQGAQGPAGSITGLSSDGNNININSSSAFTVTSGNTVGITSGAVTTINSGESLNINAGASVTIQVGGTSLQITPAGVNIVAPLVTVNGLPVGTTP